MHPPLVGCSGRLGGHPIRMARKKIANAMQQAQHGISLRIPRLAARYDRTESRDFPKEWCRGRESNPHDPCGPQDFKSCASASFATPARVILNLVIL